MFKLSFSFIKRAIYRRRMCGDGCSMAIMSDHRSTDVTYSQKINLMSHYLKPGHMKKNEPEPFY